MANMIGICLRTKNQAAKDFTEKMLIDENGDFTFSKLVPVPRIITKTSASTRFVVTPEELQAFKEQNADRVNTEFESEGLLYIEDDNGDIEESHCTQECSEKLLEQYGANTWYDWQTENWGVKWDATTVNEYDADEGSIDFDTPWDVPYVFLSKIADACPEGQWILFVEADGGYEGMHIEIQDGDVILTQHWLQKPYNDDDDDDDSDGDDDYEDDEDDDDDPDICPNCGRYPCVCGESDDIDLDQASEDDDEEDDDDDDEDPDICPNCGRYPCVCGESDDIDLDQASEDDDEEDDDDDDDDDSDDDDDYEDDELEIYWEDEKFWGSEENLETAREKYAELGSEETYAVELHEYLN